MCHLTILWLVLLFAATSLGYITGWWHGRRHGGPDAR